MKFVKETYIVSRHTTLGSQKSKFVKNYKRHNSKIVPYEIKMKHYMSYG